MDTQTWEQLQKAKSQLYNGTLFGRCARDILSIMTIEDFKPQWSKSLARRLRRAGYKKTTIYRAIDHLEALGLIHVLRNHWGNAIAARTIEQWQREIWQGFISPF